MGFVNAAKAAEKSGTAALVDAAYQLLKILVF
jgi:hypothetical protein